MKKLLTILGSVGLVATTSATVIACGDKSQQKAPDKKEENKPAGEKKEEKTEESKKEEENKEETKQPNFSSVENQVFSNFEPDENNIIPQTKIKEELAKKLDVSQPELQELKVDYEKKTGSVFLPKHNKTLNFKFSTYLELGELQAEKKNNFSVVSQTKIKEELAKKLKTDSSKLQELKVDYEKNTGTVKGPKSSNPIEFRFSVKEAK
ncbi:lipoprotein [Mycoplasma mycoides]|uniref:lipoprotein n=2 Tax=Mycoplasma mycoides TaxID=2102 RepID=UPI002734227D|nr:lipoprotein [Mycoplasma mycoides]MDP4040870.1 lipoprotein [Mycoplasma mycoides]MDP4041739.1 lipoprotein [Mycoplasma mycoides]MDP4042628.1 lipoprotein [Mycoplasma mycoides]MDP4044094.1 lipoprotein [Mycoplasma mycoides]MDP4044967.1 lipoprotein [Mycoplasma mycoides]